MHQLTLSAKSEVRFTMLIGYTSSRGAEWIGYLPTIRAAVEGGYGAGYNTTVAVGTGERLMRLSLRRIGEMQGGLKTTPTED